MFTSNEIYLIRERNAQTLREVRANRLAGRLQQNSKDVRRIRTLFGKSLRKRMLGPLEEPTSVICHKRKEASL